MMPKSRNSILVIVVVPLVCQLVYLAMMTVLVNRADAIVTQQNRSRAIVASANAVQKLFYDGGVAMGGYSVTKSPLFSDRFDKIIREMPGIFVTLKGLVGDNVREQQALANASRIAQEGLIKLGESKAAIDERPLGTADVSQFRGRHMYSDVHRLSDELDEKLHVLIEDESAIANDADAVDKSRALVRFGFIGGVILNLLIALGVLAVSRKISAT